MNQILKTNFNNDDEYWNKSVNNYEDDYEKYIIQNAFKKTHKKTRIFLRAQLYFSVVLILVIGTVIIIRNVNSNNDEKLSEEILSNYNITKLYANLSDNNASNNDNINTSANANSSVLGIIEIPNIDIYYPIFSDYNEKLLKISPCKFYGPNPGENGNLCIAGHNYDNDKFFSRISNLEKNDEIFLYNNYNQKFIYYVSDIYEVKADNLSPIYSYNKKYKQLTLITCNNLNNNRIIVQALLNS